MLEQGLHSRLGLVRKGCAFALRAPKKWAQTCSREAEYARTPPVLANSFPKSGTHLLDQIVAALPDRRNYGSFLASLTSSFQFRRRSDAETCSLVRGFVPGELVRGHLWHSSTVADALAARRAVHYLIIRDPRDVVVSEAHYLRSSNRWHKLHSFFRATASMEDAISLCIRGLNDVVPEIEYVDIGKRLAEYEGWFTDPDVCTVRFEELTSPQRDETLVRMIKFYADRTERDVDADSVLSRMKASIVPEKSHTFRSGTTGGWRKSFTDEHRELFKKFAGAAIIRLGYESVANW